MLSPVGRKGPSSPQTPKTPPLTKKIGNISGLFNQIFSPGSPQPGNLQTPTHPLRTPASQKKPVPGKRKARRVHQLGINGRGLFHDNNRATVYTPAVLLKQGDETFQISSPVTKPVRQTTETEPLDDRYYHFMNKKRPGNNIGLVLQARQNFMKRVSEQSSMY